MLIITFDLK